MERRIYNSEESKILSQINDELVASDPILQRCRLVSFLSYSRGGGRKREAREVNFLVIDGHAYQVVAGEVKGGDHQMRPDALAAEILEDMPWEDRSVDVLLARVKSTSFLIK
jgi:hypothetical protein